jgi:4-hydroxy-3-polyprenylbenzoate decarboxylase
MLGQTPLRKGKWKSMLQAAESGANVLPPAPAFSARPKSLEAMVSHSVERCLDLFDIDTNLVQRWNGLGKAKG